MRLRTSATTWKQQRSLWDKRLNEKWEKSLVKKKETTYHFRYLKSCVVLHIENAGNSGVWGIVQKSRHEGSTRIFIHLDWDSLSSQKEHPHVLHWRLSFSEKRNTTQKLRYFFLVEDIGWLWMGRRIIQALKWFLTNVLWDDKGFPCLMIGNVVSRLWMEDWGQVSGKFFLNENDW